MNKAFHSSLILVFLSSLTALGAGADSRCYEMRTYYAAPGKLDDLHARFRTYTCRLFEKHGMINIGYWVPLENPENKLIYILAYPSREAREQAWKGFMADPEWQAAYKKSEENGQLVAKVESIFLSATDYSPKIKPAQAGPRVFELRTYTATPGHLADLNARFRDHTVALFAKHGINSVGYWTPMKDQKGAEDTLIYILAHKSREAAAEAFKAFGQDPAWQTARKASEDKAGGPLTVKDGVKSLFMAPTDYSPIK
jgi:hypothetical protein